MACFFATSCLVQVHANAPMLDCLSAHGHLGCLDAHRHRSAGQHSPCCTQRARERACADGDAYTRLDVRGLAEEPAGDRTPWHSRSLQQPSQLIRCSISAADSQWAPCDAVGRHQIGKVCVSNVANRSSLAQSSHHCAPGRLSIRSQMPCHLVDPGVATGCYSAYFAAPATGGSDCRLHHRCGTGIAAQGPTPGRLQQVRVRRPSAPEDRRGALLRVLRGAAPAPARRGPPAKALPAQQACAAPLALALAQVLTLGAAGSQWCGL